MGNKFFWLAMVLPALFVLASCDDEETYAEQKEKERDAIAAFLGRNVNIIDETGDTICKVGVINKISEEQFLAQDTVTDLSRNEYVLFSSSGVYMQIVLLHSKKTKQI